MGGGGTPHKNEVGTSALMLEELSEEIGTLGSRNAREYVDQNELQDRGGLFDEEGGREAVISREETLTWRRGIVRERLGEDYLDILKAALDHGGDEGGIDLGWGGLSAGEVQIVQEKGGHPRR